jgi:hypothetical protein
MGRTHPNLVGHWRFEDNLLDTSGNGQNASLVSGSANYVKGRVGNAYTFPVSENRLSAGSGSLSTFDSGQPFSVCFWIRATNHAKFGAIISTQDGGATGRGIQVGLAFNPSPNVVLLRLQGVNRLQRQGTVQVDTGNWVHVAMTYDGSKHSSGLFIYVNGVPDQGGAVTENDPAGMTTTQPVYFGTRNVSQIPYEGDLDDVQIWNRALQPHHIRAIYNGVDPSELGDIA